MADFVAVIRKAVDGLTENTPELRAKVYDKARAAIRRQLDNMSPKPPEELVNRQLEKLDDAIREVEQEHSEALPSVDDFEDALTEATEHPDEAPVVAAPPPPPLPPEPEPEPVLAPEPEPEPVIDPEPEVPPRPAPVPRASEPTLPPQGAFPPPPAARPETEAGEEHDEIFGLRPDDAPEQTERPSKPKAKGGGRSMARLALVVVLLAILGGAAYGLWLNRDSLGEMTASLMDSAGTVPALFGGDEETAAPDVTPAEETATQEEPVETDTGPAPAETTDTGEQPSEPGGKFTQRLLADGSEVDPGPAVEATQPVAGGGRSVAAQNAPVAEEDANATTDEGENEAAPTETVDPGNATIGVAQKSFLYEERLGQEAPTAMQGTVIWTLENESPGAGQPAEPVIQGQVTIPEKGITALLTIKRNTDPSLPASHLLEIVFSLPGEFDGGGIEALQRIALKQTEEVRGDALIAVPAKITEDFFMVALNDFPEAVAANTELLRTRNWIDMPITYANGRRALITLEKGASGAEVFDEALKVWAANTPQPAAPAAQTEETAPAETPQDAPANGN